MPKGFTGAAVVPEGAKCKRCGARWRQHAGGLCRVCHNADEMSDPVRVAVRILRQFIGRSYVRVKPMKPEAYRQSQEAENALDLLVERLRTGASEAERAAMNDGLRAIGPKVNDALPASPGGEP